MHSSKSPIIVWAVVLFFGFHILGELIGWLLLQNFDLTQSLEPARIWEIPNALYVVAFVFMVVPYLFVRRLGHHVLSNLWLYVIIVGAIGLVFGPALASLDSENAQLWWATAFALAQVIVLVWFARRVSAASFRHSLLLIGLVAVMQSPIIFVPPHLHIDPEFVWPVPRYITHLIGGALLRGLAVWSLVNAQTVTSSTRTVLPPVLAMVIIAAVLFGLNSPIWVLVRVEGWSSLLYVGVSSLIAPALAVVITYAVRVRRPADPEGGLKLQPS